GSRVAYLSLHGALPILDPGTPYYLGVSCVSRSGVESYLCTRQAVLTSTLIPKGVQNLTAVTGAGVTLSWDVVTQFTDDSTISTPDRKSTRLNSSHVKMS